MLKLWEIVKSYFVLSKKTNYVKQSAGFPKNTSKTIYTASNGNTPRPKITLAFCQWLAGLIDGDGSLLVSKRGYTSCEITVGLADVGALLLIQSLLGGSIKPRTGVRAVRYRLHSRKGMALLISCVNGHIRHTDRLAQLASVCQVLDIIPLAPSLLSTTHAWFSGFFDADGTITFSIKNGFPQLTIRVGNKLAINLSHFLQLGIGNLYFDSSQKGCWKWTIQSRQDLETMLSYFEVCPSRTDKSNRLSLVPRFLELRDIRAYKPTSSAYPLWESFLKDWGTR